MVEGSSHSIVTCHPNHQRGLETPRDELVKDTAGKWEEGAEVGRIITDEIYARHRRRWSTEGKRGGGSLVCSVREKKEPAWWKIKTLAAFNIQSALKNAARRGSLK